jgi:hypothetical protein
MKSLKFMVEFPGSNLIFGGMSSFVNLKAFIVSFENLNPGIF